MEIFRPVGLSERMVSTGNGKESVEHFSCDFQTPAEGAGGTKSSGWQRRQRLRICKAATLALVGSVS